MRARSQFSAALETRKRRVRRLERVALAATLVGFFALACLLVGVLYQGVRWLDVEFLTSYPSRRAENAGFKAAIVGSLWCIGLTALISVPLGVAAAVYLEEYCKKGRLYQTLDVVIANLAGVPSIIYGMLGMIAFVRMFSLFGEGVTVLGFQLPFGRSLLAGASTLSLLVLPVIIIATREALRAVPNSLRLAAFGLGATRWQCVRHHVLPSALPGVMTGVVLAISRALGETAPLIMMGALTYVAFLPQSLFDPFTAMPIQIFNWASRPQQDFHYVAAAGIIVLLVVLLSLNAAAVLLRNWAERWRVR